MLKKIATEKDLSYHFFKVKVGTIDKKNPTVIYVEGGTYIKPNENKKNYSDDIHEIKKLYRDNIRNLVFDNKIFTSDYICTIDIPIERITPKKKTYISFQYTLKQKNNIDFYELIKEYNNIFIDNILTNIHESLENYGFSLTKSKK